MIRVGVGPVGVTVGVDEGPGVGVGVMVEVGVGVEEGPGVGVGVMVGVRVGVEEGPGVGVEVNLGVGVEEGLVIFVVGLIQSLSTTLIKQVSQSLPSICCEPQKLFSKQTELDPAAIICSFSWQPPERSVLPGHLYFHI